MNKLTTWHETDKFMICFFFFIVISHTGESSEPLDGLYVVDGAILPRAVGINPVLTIACLAERCMRLMAEREGWIIDYDTFIPLGKNVE